MAEKEIFTVVNKKTGEPTDCEISYYRGTCFCLHTCKGGVPIGSFVVTDKDELKALLLDNDFRSGNFGDIVRKALRAAILNSGDLKHIGASGYITGTTPKRVDKVRRQVRPENTNHKEIHHRGEPWLITSRSVEDILK